MQKKWILQDANPKLQKELGEQFSIHPVVAQLLINRNITDPDEIKQFLKPTAENLHDPFLYKDMKEAVERINQAAAARENVLIYGDYDVDGVTSTTFLHAMLKRVGINAIPYLPHRMTEGYGLSTEIIDVAREQKVSLIITVDCGVTAVDEVKAIKDSGVDVIIFDHHEPGDEGVPDATAVVDPKQKDCAYPFKSLATIGMMAKLSQALFGAIDEDYLDLVAIGTIADMVPLRGENRILVKMGLPKINKTKHKGLLALLEKTKIKDKKISPFHIGFVLGPRINAAGRMDSAHKSLDLFMAQDSNEAVRLADALEEHNLERQRMQRSVVDEAISIVEEDELLRNQNVIVLSKEGWHKGVLGIVASRIKEKYYRPAIVISVDEEGIGTASCRSVDGFQLHTALASCADCLETYGGHAGAAGLTIKQECIEDFTTMINDVANDTLTEEELLPALSVDCEIALTSVSMALIKTICAMEPHGEGNPSPVFCARNLTVNSFPQVLGKNTLKFWVTDGQVAISAVGFGMADFATQLHKGKMVDIVFQLSIDDWNKAPTPQLILKDIKVKNN